MPLVHIHVVEDRRDAAALRRLADVVQSVMLDVFAAPPRDRYQLITEHKPGHIIAEDTGLGYTRTPTTSLSSRSPNRVVTTIRRRSCTRRSPSACTTSAASTATT